MKFKFSFNGIPTFGYCVPSRPDIENVMGALIEKSPEKFTSRIDRDDIDWYVQDVLVDGLDIEPKNLKVIENRIEYDISGAMVEFHGHMLFKRVDGKPIEIVDLTEEFTSRMLNSFNDEHGCCDYLDFSVLENLFDDNFDEGYYLTTNIEENNVEVKTKLTN